MYFANCALCKLCKYCAKCVFCVLYKVCTVQYFSTFFYVRYIDGQSITQYAAAQIDLDYNSLTHFEIFQTVVEL